MIVLSLLKVLQNGIHRTQNTKLLKQLGVVEVKKLA